MHIALTMVVVITTHAFQERIITTLGTVMSKFSSYQDARRHPSSPFDGETVTRTKLGDTQLSALYEWLGKVRRSSTLRWAY